MRGFLVICLCATVLAAPQGYNYNQQQNGFSVASPSFNTDAQVTSTTKSQESHSILQQAVSSGTLQQALSGGQNSGQNIQQFSTAPNFPQYFSTSKQNVGLNEPQQEAPVITNYEGQKQQQELNGYQQHQQYQAPGTVTKDIYVHVAPEDQTQQYQQPALPSPPPRKHYRIVFIKAPSQNANNAALRIQQAPTEEKTIIYVLTKKSDALDFQTIQELQPKQPSKPEVYFIKYKTKEEAQHAQRTIQAQYDQLGGTSQVSDEGVAPVASYIGSLDGSKQTGLNFSNSSGLSSSLSSSSSSSSTSSSSSSLISGGAGNKGSNYLPPIVKL